MRLPSGTVTFVFTDIEGSTRLWEQVPDRMGQALTRHTALIKEAFEQRHNGYVFKTAGDGCCAVFHSAPEAVEAALDAQRALLAEDFSAVGSLRVRMAVHTGPAQLQEDPPDYFGATLSRVDRLIKIGRGGHVLLSEAAGELARDQLPEGAALRDLGYHSLPDMQRERIFLLTHPALPAGLPTRASQELWPNNLPHLLTSFVGRERQMQEIHPLLATTRLLTLTGAGGCGKTRLALQVASGLLEQSGDGVWLVELAPLSDPALIPQTVADALEVREAPGRPLQEALIEHLKPRHLLLLLDNCEHLLAASATFATALLRACPNLTILATSREGMGVAGELVYPVLPLALPDAESRHSAEALISYEAVRLFVERAAFRKPGFALTDQNAEAIRQICRRLDGIPLALELAAARVGLLSVEQIARFDDYFRLLTGGNRTGLFHHQTLKAALDWSYGLLSEAEQALFRQLSVFAGGWTLETAEAVCGADGYEVLNLLSRLVDSSLVIAEDQEGVKRFHMLETVRQYAHQKLEEANEADLLRERHRDVFLALAEEAEPQLQTAEKNVWSDRLEREHDNLRAALAWKAEGEMPLRLAGTLWRFWYARGHVSEGRSWLENTLAGSQEADPIARAKVLNGVGILAMVQGDYIPARLALEESAELYRRSGHEAGLAATLMNLVRVIRQQGDYAAALACIQEALDLTRKAGNKQRIAHALLSFGILAREQADFPEARARFEEARDLSREIGYSEGIAHALMNLGVVSQDEGDYSQARSYYEQSLALRRASEDRWNAAMLLGNLGEVALFQQDYPAAQRFLLESVTILGQLGDRNGVAHVLVSLAALAAAQQDYLRAARLLGAEEGLRAIADTPLHASLRVHHEHALAAARSALSEEDFSAAWTEGRALSLEQAVSYALHPADS